MKSKISLYISALLLSVVLLSVCEQAAAQQHPERRVIRGGNKNYDKEDYAGAEEKYRKALEKMPLSYEGAFNLSDALYRQKKYDESTALLKTLSENPTLSAEQRGNIFYNIGNNMFRQEKLQEAADYYKESLRANPSDMDAKYNLAYVNRLMEQQNDKNNQNNEDNKDGEGNKGENAPDDKDQNKDKKDKNKDDSDKGDDKQDKGDENQDKQDGDDKQQPDKPKPENGEGGQQPKISRDNAESILNAIQQQEDNTRDKVNQQKAVSVGPSGKNW